MTRILLIADQFLRPHRTGIDVYYDSLVHWLPRLAPDLDFTLASLGEPDQQSPAFAPNFRHKGLPLSRRRFYLASLLRLGNPFQALLDQADLVHLMVPLPLATDKPLLTTVHDLTPLLMPWAYTWYSVLITRWTLRRLAAQKSHFIAVSDCTKSDLHRLTHVPMDRIHRVYEGVGEAFRVIDDTQQIEQARARYGLPERYFLYTGSMHPRKNLLTALKAYRLFKAHDTTDTKLVLAGRMSVGGAALTRQIREHNLEESVVLPGYIDGADLSAVIGGAVAVIYPSLYEGFGFPALEAMACGVPVIASNASSLPEVTGGHALLCDPLDARCFAESMQRIVSDAGLRDALVRGGFVWVKRFSWKAAAQETLQLYAHLLRREDAALS